jgi:PhoD-like phosphatase, N-terminal domain/PhoD-like phosphatase
MNCTRYLVAKAAFIMKLQSALFACLALGAMTMSGTVANGIPSAEMFQAKTIEEYQRLRSLPGGSSINETLKDEIYQLKKERQLLELSQPLLASSFNGTPGFYHGVASGDPLPDAVILWTRYTPLTADANITLELRITPLVPGLETSAHLDPNANGELRRVAVIVTSASDWIAKIDVTQLSSNTNYVFAFADASNNVSPIGQTRTAPDNDADVSQMVYAVFSCSNFGSGYFHAYDIASTIQNLDFWVHVGDYIVSPVLSAVWLWPSQTC